MNNAIVFLCKDLSRSLCEFANKVQNYGFNVLVIVDNKYSLSQMTTTDKFNCCVVDDEVCEKSGYVGCNITGSETHIKKKVIAWDKFLYVVCESDYANTKFPFYWVFEEDVFIPSVDTIKNLNEKYSKNDLVCANNFHKSYEANDWHWPKIVDKINPPYFHSMVSGCGISSNLLSEIKRFVNDKKTLFHIEAMFNTLAMQNKLNVADPLEFKSVVWMGDWGLDEFLLLPNNVFHPVKDISNHERLRQEIKEAKESKYKPKNKLPDFIKSLM